MKPRVLWTNQPPDADVAPLSDVAEVVRGGEGVKPMSREAVLEAAGEVDAIVNQAELRVDDEVLDAAPRLRVVGNVAIGTNNLDLQAMARRNVWATHVPDAFAESAADFTFALLLAVARRLVEADAYVRRGDWPGDGFQPGAWDGLLLSGKTLGIVGFGKIGRAVAQRAEAFGMAIRVNDPRCGDDPRFLELDELCETADVLTLHCPLVDNTRGLMDAGRLARMKPEAILINMARGPVVVESDLAAALESGKLGGAGLDVFENEPEVHQGLRAHPRAVLSPHIGGGTKTSRRDARLTVARDVAAVLKGERPGHPVIDLASPPGDRS